MYLRPEIERKFDLALADKDDHEYGFFYHHQCEQIQYFTKKDLEDQMRNFAIQGARVIKTYDIHHKGKNYKVICFNSERNLKANDTIDPFLMFIGGHNPINAFAYWIPQ